MTMNSRPRMTMPTWRWSGVSSRLYDVAFAVSLLA